MRDSLLHLPFHWLMLLLLKFLISSFVCFKVSFLHITLYSRFSLYMICDYHIYVHIHTCIYTYLCMCICVLALMCIQVHVSVQISVTAGACVELEGSLVCQALPWTFLWNPVSSVFSAVHARLVGLRISTYSRVYAFYIT